MLTVDDYEVIRRTVLVDGASQRAAARRLGHSRKTIKKALQHSTPPGYQRAEPVRRPAIDPARHIIDAWLEEDKQRPPKQRHTGTRVFERLRDEHDFKGSASAVRRYVAHKKATSGEVFFPLVFDPGEEAQIDWGEARCVIGGAERKAFLFCMRLCHSTASYVRAYERQNQESLLDGHVRGFGFFGGVARRCAYDNLKSAARQCGERPEASADQEVPGAQEPLPVPDALLQCGMRAREGPRGESGAALAEAVHDASATGGVAG